MHEVALTAEAVPAGDHLDAVGLALVDESHDAGELLLADQGPDHAALFVGAAQLQVVRHHRNALHDLVYTPRCTKILEPQTHP
jgi:hypothetical protein